jgi:DNA invertase Pin-like site-specific DNA recombinase
MASDQFNYFPGDVQGHVPRAAISVPGPVVLERRGCGFRSDVQSISRMVQPTSTSVYSSSSWAPTPVTKSGISKLLFTILSAFASFERERIRDQKRDAKQRRVFTGALPFGWRVVIDGDGVKRLAVDQAEQDIIREIPRLRATGLSYHKIAEAIRARGVPISHMTVKRVLLGLIKPEPEKGEPT